MLTQFEMYAAELSEKMMKKKEDETTATCSAQWSQEKQMFLETKNQILRRLGIPKEFHDATLENFKGSRPNLESWNPEICPFLFLHGGPGCGKTHLVVALLKMWELRFPKNGLFKSVPELLLEIRWTYSPTSAETEKEVVEKYQNVQFLVLDDIGAEKSSEATRAALYVIINRREMERLPTIITSNLDPVDLQSVHSPAIASRLTGGITCKIKANEDFRKRRRFDPFDPFARSRKNNLKVNQ